MEKVDKSTLGYLGSDFQYKAVKALIEEPKLFMDLYPILEQNSFSDPVIRKIVGTAKDMYSKNKIVPSYFEIETKLRSKERDEAEVMYICETIQKLKDTSSVGTEIVKEELIDFFKWKFAILNVNQALEKLKDGFDEKAYKKFISETNKLSSFGMDGSTTMAFTSDNNIKVLTEGDEEIIPTGIKELDDRIAGGIARKDIGLFTALTGYGKTTFGSIIAFNAAFYGFKVLQIYFEDKDTDLYRKHLAIIMKQGMKSLRNLTDKSAGMANEKILSTPEWEAVSKNLVCVKMLDKQTTVEDIDAKISELVNSTGFRPDLVVIDYFSCLKFSRSPMKDVWAAQADCMRKIKELAYQYNMAVWVLQQNNRPSNDKTAGMANWQGSYEATQPASVWIELQRTKEQKENGRADLIFNKTRKSQPKDDLLDIVFDNSTMTIDCSNYENELEELY